MVYLYNNTKTKAFRRQLRRDQTDAERLVWGRIRNRQVDDYKFVRQYGIGSYILDFYCSAGRLAVELDGGQHAEETRSSDEKRTKFLAEKGIRVLRFWNNEVMENIEGVLETIRENINKK